MGIVVGASFGPVISAYKPIVRFLAEFITGTQPILGHFWEEEGRSAHFVTAGFGEHNEHDYSALLYFVVLVGNLNNPKRLRNLRAMGQDAYLRMLVNVRRA